MEKINLIRSTILESTPNSNQVGLLDVFLAQLRTVVSGSTVVEEVPKSNSSQTTTTISNFNPNNIFDPLYIVVPNLSFGDWLADKITDELGICSNIIFITMEQFIALHYTENIINLKLNTDNCNKLFDFNQALYFIYDLFLNQEFYQELFTNDIQDNQLKLLHEYLYGVKLNKQSFPIKISDYHLNYSKLFELADNLTTIFHEYLYLRTEEIVSSKFFTLMPHWQKVIWDKLLAYIKCNNKYSFLDIFSNYKDLDTKALYTNPVRPSDAIIHSLDYRKHASFKQVFIFGVYSIYPSVCKILRQIAMCSEISWYYLSVSMSYYGDLLSSFAVAKLQQKILKEPFISIEDLYLVDGNQLVANLAQQSREFTELLLANEINIIDLNSNLQTAEYKKFDSLLNLIQSDIRLIKRRVGSQYRLYPQLDCYSSPLQKLSNLDNSLIINICYNKMREVQVLFDQILELLNVDDKLKFSDILITAPDINLYAPYIKAVFDNEYALDDSGNQIRLPYLITGNRLQKDLKIIDCYQELFNIPYIITVSYLIDFVSQDIIMQVFDLDLRDLELIECWIKDNHTHFGYNKEDYLTLGYKSFDIYGFHQLLIKLQLGVAMTTQTIDLSNDSNLYDILPYFSIGEENYICYDNVEASHVELISKLIRIIDLFILVRDFIYLNNLEYKGYRLSEFIQLMEQVSDLMGVQTPNLDIINELLGKIKDIKLSEIIDAKVFLSIIDKLCKSFNTKVIFTGKITCASMQSIHHIPYPAIFMLGMNYNEFPRIHHPSKLSLLSKEWAVADRNANLEDKQLFLDTILSAGKYLQISYIGRNQQDNSIIEPSSVIKLLLDMLEESIVDKDFLVNHIIRFYPLHPFTNYKPYANWSAFWHKFNNHNYSPINIGNNVFNSNNLMPLDDLSPEQKNSSFDISSENLHNTFYYVNYNLYRMMGIGVNYSNLNIIDDTENLSLITHEIRRDFFKQISKMRLTLEAYSKDSCREQVYSYILATGIINYGALGKYQFNLLYDLYTLYLKVNHKLKIVKFVIKSNTQLNTTLTLTSDLHIDENNNLILQDDFTSIREIESVYDFSAGNLYKIYVKCLLGAVIAEMTGFYNITSYADESSFIVETTNSNDLNTPSAKLPIKEVYLRLISQSKKILSYKVSLSSKVAVENVWNGIKNLYINSLTNPTVIHRGAIISYLEGHNEQDSYQRLIKTYESAYNNYELSALLKDLIIGDNSPNYLNLCPIENNTLLNIANLIKLVKLELC